MFFRKMKLAPRSIFGFGLCGLVVLLLGLFSLSMVKQMSVESDAIREVWVPGIIRLAALNNAEDRAGIMTFRMVALRDPAALTANQNSLMQVLENVRQQQDAFTAHLRQSSEREIFQRYLDASTAFRHEQLEVIRLAGEGQRQAATDILNGPIDKFAIELGARSGQLLDFYLQQYQQVAELEQQTRQRVVTGVIAAIALAALLTVILATLYTRSINQPLLEALKVAQNIARGDLTSAINDTGNDEPALLLQALKTMQLHLHDTVLRITGSSTQLALSSQQFHGVIATTTSGLQEQNKEIEQAAAAVNEMTAAVDEVARHASATALASGTTDAAAQTAKARVMQTLESLSALTQGISITAARVQELAGSVSGINRVLEVIRSIAEQTNLLALNAAIEAARAGEAGRGFAVVAEEVRALAFRTQQSTGEIEQMVSSVHNVATHALSSMQLSTDRVHSTLGIAQEAESALQEVTVAVETISQMNVVIASASEQQALASREIDRSLVNIQNLSVHTSASAVQIHSTSEELSQLAAGLRGLIDRFRI
ncbi:methyl-accepting chemotaxis protein [Pseudomonas nunensis]|uniref:Methyl-accepting chemotaxis protein n=2 Tax=Pseudomonas nunensis TaxID=2961896 RepID=A0ABY5EH58_9PSED|nr:methyl-accepting chemotaxis protein [Pseudomonas nunensis]MCL5227189.1 methyl-accepting chemotaxis protein [Pseudomonas nunensis]UTO14573.1 methyl-accepting chemotaxis protein [Pseudomonas nunensis]